MQRHKPQSIGEVLRNLLEETSLQNRMDELHAATLWSKIAGPELAAQTRHPQVKAGIMSIGVPNAALRNELLMNRTRLREIINSTLGKEIISEIKFTS